MRESRLRKIESQLSEMSPGTLEGKTRVDFWKEVLRGNRERPKNYYKNVEKSDAVCELLAREDLDLKIPEELTKAFEDRVESFATALEVGKSKGEVDREEVKGEVREISRKAPANWNFQKVMEGFNHANK